MSQPQQQKPQGEGVYYLCMDGEHELRIAKAWFKAKFPQGTAAKLVQELRIARLMDQHTVIAIYREDGCTPALLSPIDHVTGGRRIEPVAIDDAILKEVVEGKPVRVRDHWRARRSDDDYSDGDIDRSSFFRALGATLRSPVCIKRSLDQQFISLGTA